MTTLLFVECCSDFNKEVVKLVTDSPVPITVAQ